MHLGIHYRTSFDYPEPVRQSHNEVRAAPTTDHHQRLTLYRITSNPSARVFSHLDHWGTLVDAFGIRLHHDRLDIDVEALVETSARVDPEGGGGPAGDYGTPAFADAHWELLQPSGHVAISDHVRDLVATAEPPASGSAIDLVDSLVECVRSKLTYVSGSTDIGATVDDVLAQGQGVCQDYAHVLCAVARAKGIPARYVSGYLYARDESVGVEDDDGSPLSVQTHAWVELAVPGGGWISRDPTNGEPVGEHHVKIGHGRDYEDVAPVKGVYQGGAEPVLTAGVEMRRVLPAESRPEGIAARPAHLLQQQQQISQQQ